MLRWFLLIPFALLIAIGAAGFALLVASILSPEVGMLIGGGFMGLMAALFDQVSGGFDPGPTAESAFALLGRLGLAILVAPVVLTALASETLRLRSGLLLSLVAGCLTVLLPLALLGFSRTPTGAESRIIGALFLTGAFAGFVYWLIAGRDAGGRLTPRGDAPPPAA